MPNAPLAAGIAAGGTGGATLDAGVSVGRAGPDAVGPTDIVEEAGTLVGTLRDEVAAEVAAAELDGAVSD